MSHLIHRAQDDGAALLTETTVLDWEASASGVRVHSTAGVHTAERLVLAAGAWTPTLARRLGLPIQVERRVMHFWRPSDPAAYGTARMPTFIWDLDHGDSIYGFPSTGPDSGVKVGFHNRGVPADVSRPQSPGTSAEIAEMRAVLQDVMPGVPSRHLRSIGCTYALTPDHDFVLGFAPGFGERVVVAAGFSGHGFKFVPVVGEVVADLVVRGETPYDIGFLSPDRFTSISR